jgi:peptidoglycan/xylan/chitin deacetylase (PgdA/CDA1 family)
MKIRKLSATIIFTLVIIIIAGISHVQSYEVNAAERNSDFKWPEGKKMGLSLTFDDARLSQVDKGIPLLNSYGVKATFYLSPDNMKKRLSLWKKAVTSGHDIGNHSLLHPCSGNFAW